MNIANRFQRSQRSSPEHDPNPLPVAASSPAPPPPAAYRITSDANGADLKAAVPEAIISDVTSPDAATGSAADAAAGSNSAAAKKPFWKNTKIMVALWVVMLGIIPLGLLLQVDKSIIAGTVFLFGLVSHAFSWLLGLIALVPFAGPLVVKVLEIPFVWLLNGIGYLVSLVAIRRGYSKDVLTYRMLTIAVITGITIGYILGKLF